MTTDATTIYFQFGDNRVGLHTDGRSLIGIHGAPLWPAAHRPRTATSPLDCWTLFFFLIFSCCTQTHSLVTGFRCSNSKLMARSILGDSSTDRSRDPKFRRDGSTGTRRSVGLAESRNGRRDGGSTSVGNGDHLLQADRTVPPAGKKGVRSRQPSRLDCGT